MAIDKSLTLDDLLVSNTFLEIQSKGQTERFYFQNIKHIRLSSQTNYLITALSWLFEVLFHAGGAGKYKDDYLEIITKDDQSMKWQLVGKDKKQMQKIIKAVQKHLKQ